MTKLIIPCIVGLLLASCSGYRLKSKENPFFRFGITSVTIPMFLNESNIANVSGPFTREISSFLMGFSGLRVYPGDNDRADAVLLGIIRSDQHRNNSVKTIGYKLSSDIAPMATTGRRKYYLPRQTALNLQLNIVLIRNPSRQDIELLKSDLGPYVRNHPKVIYNELIAVDGSFTRNINDEEAVAVNQTQNAGLLNKTINKMAQETVTKFKEMILYAF